MKNCSYEECGIEVCTAGPAALHEKMECGEECRHAWSAAAHTVSFNSKGSFVTLHLHFDAESDSAD